MNDLFAEPDGATPLTDEEQEGLKQSWITTREDLNQAEAANIADALAWAQSSRARRRDILSIDYILLLHKKMFGDVWGWAGRYRTTGTSIGVDANRITAELMQRLSDVSYWV